MRTGRVFNVGLVTVETPKPKPKPRRNRKAEQAAKALAATASAESFDTALKESEDEVIKAMRELVEMDLNELEGRERAVNESAKVTASIKVLDLLGDKGSPSKLLAKLEALKLPALAALRAVVNNGVVAAARANAGAYLLKAIKLNAPSVWPPNVTEVVWQERMALANAMCKLEVSA